MHNLSNLNENLTKFFLKIFRVIILMFDLFLIYTDILSVYNQ